MIKAKVENENRRTIAITLTEACNLKCSYCYENHKSSKKMSSDVLHKIIYDEMTADNGFDELEIDFFGGEPFLCFDLIKDAEEYIKNMNSSKKYILFATTNGTLVHGEIKNWLSHHDDVLICGLSFDGTKTMQDINRSNSFDSIDLDFFKKHYPLQDIKMTISENTLAHLAEGVVFLHEKGFDVSCNLAYNINWSNDKNREILQGQLLQLIDYYLSHETVKPCSMLEMPITNVSKAYGKGIYHRFCGAGTYTVTYHIDGTAYPCQFFMPLSVGEEKAKNALSLKFYKDDIPEELIEKKCRHCVVQPICPTCYGANYAATGNMYRHDDNYCELTKIIIKARSYFKAMQWQKGQLNLPEEELVHLLNSIKIIQNEL